PLSGAVRLGSSISSQRDAFPGTTSIVRWSGTIFHAPWLSAKTKVHTPSRVVLTPSVSVATKRTLVVATAAEGPSTRSARIVHVILNARLPRHTGYRTA